MGLISGAISFVRYRVTGEEPEPFREVIDERIRAFVFRELEPGTGEQSMGWVGLDNFLDTEFQYAGYSMGDYLAFSLRVDRRAVPRTLLKKHMLQEEQKFLTQSGKKRISREEKKEIQERVHVNLLSRTLPVPAIYDVCWCVSQRWLLFGCNNSNIRKDFERLFKRCFYMDLVPYIPWDAAFVPDDTAEKLLSLSPSSLTG